MHWAIINMLGSSKDPENRATYTAKKVSHTNGERQIISTSLEKRLTYLALLKTFSERTLLGRTILSFVNRDLGKDSETSSRQSHRGQP